MQSKISHLSAALVGAVAALASLSSQACSLEPVDPGRIKQLMAGEIAHRLGVPVARIPLSAISPPQLHTPFPLGADCSGLGALHHSAGFRWDESQHPGPEPVPGLPPTASLANVDRLPQASATRSSGAQQCAYEGVAVVLGFDYSSPVAIHFNRRCR